MKAKPIFWMLAVLMICSIFSLSQGTDKFYYGTYGGRPHADFESMKDSLKFNIVYGNVTDTTIHYWVENSLRSIVGNYGDEFSPMKQASQSHYTLWEAEGLEGSYYGLSYNGGTLVDDLSASGGKAMKFSGPETSRIIQWGPTYTQMPGPAGQPIEYTAEFRLKFYYAIPVPPGIKSNGADPPTPVCSITVVDTVSDSILKAKTLYKSDFAGGVYQTFRLENYTVPGWNRIEFQIYLFGIDENEYFYIDYVKVYDGFGYDLIEDPDSTATDNIKAYVSQDWVHTTIPETGDTVVYRWYLRDEPGYIDLFEPSRYIDSLLREVSPERVGFQAFHHFWDDTLEHEYLLRQNPEEYHVDIYPTTWWAPDSSGETFQMGVSTLTNYLNNSKQEAEDKEKDLWVTIQAHYYGWEILPGESCCAGCSVYYAGPSHSGYYCGGLKRPPTPNELRLETFLALCYGAQDILNFCYYTRNDYHPDWDPPRWDLMLGLYDHLRDSTTARFREIKNFTGPRVEVLGSLINQLTWQGACFYDSVGSFVLRNGEFSYIDSIVGKAPESTYVEIGFFDKSDTSCFMLVNRRCLEGEDEILNVYFNFPDGPYYVTDMFTPEFPDGKICGVNPYTIALEPGEGRLFKLEKFYQNFVLCVPERFHYSCFPNNPYPTIQEAIDAALHYPSWITTILVDTGTYYENIDFKGKNLTVTSKFHLYPSSPEYISQTIIDGSMPADSDSASVVRFVSGESPCATLKGFTIRNGTGTIYIDKGEPGKYGGGIYCKDSSPTIMNNIIVGDTVTTSGGGIYCRNCSTQILNNLIKQNKAEWWHGGGIAIETDYQSYSAPILSNNVIVDNVAGQYGGGIYYWGNPYITNNTIDSNSAHAGGGIYIGGSAPRGHIENNIITNSLGGNGIRGEYGPEVMSYNDVWNNDSLDFDIIYPEGVGDTSWGENCNETPCDTFYNIIQNPNFYDGYHLYEGSTCINAGDNEAPYILPTDFEGNKRVVGFVDIGAYEFQSGSGEGGGAKIAVGDITAQDKSTGTPKEFSLSQNFPNPFNPVTRIQFTVGGDQSICHVTLKIYNISGQLVRTLLDEEKAPGTYTISWDGKNNYEKEVASGIYFYQLKSTNFKETKRMVLIK